MTKKNKIGIAKAFKIMRRYFEKHKKNRLIFLLELVGDYIYDLEEELAICEHEFNSLWRDYSEVRNDVGIYR